LQLREYGQTDERTDFVYGCIEMCKGFDRDCGSKYYCYKL